MQQHEDRNNSPPIIDLLAFYSLWHMSQGEGRRTNYTKLSRPAGCALVRAEGVILTPQCTLSWASGVEQHPRLTQEPISFQSGPPETATGFQGHLPLVIPPSPRRSFGVISRTCTHEA